MSERPTFDVRLTPADQTRALRTDAVTGLTARPKWLRPTWFYDARGSMLFDEITRLPEYYPTRTERSILTVHAADIAATTGAETLVELGSGASDKTRLLIEAGLDHGTLARFVPLDVSESALRAAAATLAARYPKLAVHGVVGDFTRHLDALPDTGHRLVVFLGGTIGNLLPPDRARFLADLRGVLHPGEWLLLGTDLVKDIPTLLAAYDDPGGVTADFNRNVLRVLNRELAGDFPVDEFAHVARWDAEGERIEMHLRAGRALTVTLAALDLTIEFADGEDLCTEISAKFRPAGIAAELSAAGFAVADLWTDPADAFAVTLARAVP
ncbi:L-histidine N(alpha)-methyltransferase [Actinocatenispora rupis]|uniref:L-histidine N(alpha)-methyltransferase n=1 Tax=Actinocatenispora rupis TaxID=519421 RepID=UPI003571230B